MVMQEGIFQPTLVIIYLGRLSRRRTTLERSHNRNDPVYRKATQHLYGTDALKSRTALCAAKVDWAAERRLRFIVPESQNIT